MYNCLEFKSQEEYEKMQLTNHQLSLLNWVSYVVDENHTFLVKSRNMQAGLRKTWELE